MTNKTYILKVTPAAVTGVTAKSVTNKACRIPPKSSRGISTPAAGYNFPPATRHHRPQGRNGAATEAADAKDLEEVSGKSGTIGGEVAEAAEVAS